MTVPRRTFAAALVAVAALGLSACSSRTAATGSESGAPVSVVTAFYPLQFVVEKVGGDRVDVTSLTAPGTERPPSVSAWISPSAKLYVLTRFPDIGRSLSRREIVSLFESGRARRTDSESALDRAIEAIAQPEAA